MRAAGWAATPPFAPLVLTVAAQRLSNWAADNLGQTVYVSVFGHGLSVAGPLFLLSASWSLKSFRTGSISRTQLLMEISADL